MKKSPVSKSLVSVIAAAAVACLSAVSAFAAMDASQPVRTVLNDVRQISATRGGADREAAVRQVLQQNFDLAYIARATLGAHWGAASEEQRARFVTALEASEIRAYSERLGRLAEFNVNIERATLRADGGWTVDSSANAGLPIRLAWDVRDSGAGPRIVDVKVSGVSLFATRQAEFSAYIRRTGSIEPLVAELEARARR